MRVLSLFSGGGLGDYGLELAGMEIVGQVEIDDYCQKILKLRWPDVPKWRDIREVKGEEVVKTVGRVDLISGGFPCQPFSVAGKQRGKQDDRYLWPEMFRVVSEVKPAYVLGENVPGIIKSALDQVLSDLESIGYTCQAFTIPACAVDAPHRRDRLWVVGYNVADSESIRTQGRIRKPRTGRSESWKNSWWPIEPSICRVVDECPDRVHRLKLLGNGQVVQVVQWIGERIMEFDAKQEDGKGV